MATQGPSPLPPTTILSSKSISQSAAHDFLAAYLDRAATDPALQPNASISEHGPISRTTAAAPNLILHNLKRVQAGLAGEVLGRDLTLAKINAGEALQGESGDNVVWEETKHEQVAADDAMDDDEEEMRGEDDEENEQQPSRVGGEADKHTVDKEERKRKKKERRLAEKRAKAKGADA
ncbi:hypothetical protein KXW98_006552 [Aspergillus fumigatus]|nr:hypothetical protein CNMCM8714_005917 [Aspergillus fumigatus]KMK54504.1 hypothetical protein Y699_06148 [Aspergillus fumigatus Z5]KAF4258966.1 hypothetical protein CNMCM8812_006053 [Aspergillus fumigatus]KAF4276933.1 hypothetical protein CNMCM8057_003714 [Aspergillus fumigatus]KAH1288399.1 hypothetical protein KXX11_001679 [Aspergillus fumigatus]